jgi:phage protein D
MKELRKKKWERSNRARCARTATKIEARRAARPTKEEQAAAIAATLASGYPEAFATGRLKLPKGYGVRL